MMINDKILFFASGDFAIPTFKSLIDKHYNITGLVTSNDKLLFPERSDNKRLIDIALEHDIPVLVVKNKLNDPDIYKWIIEHDADIFCVISFKFLPDIILKCAKKVAFNIHGSILPYFRGAAPIQHALKCGFEETGLTAFVLNDKIDCGDILEIRKIKIDETDDYGSLFAKMSDKCVDFTIFIIENISIYGESYYKDNVKKQEVLQLPVEHAYAPKLNDDFASLWTSSSMKKAVNYKRAISPLNGLKMSLKLTDKKTNKIKETSFIVHDCIFNRKYNAMDVIETDLKTYLHYSPVDAEWFCDIKEIQIPGKRKMPVVEFLKGFVNIYKNNSIE